MINATHGRVLALTVVAILSGCSRKDALANQRISLRGKAVKVNPNIMGTNWLHVRDGSGTERGQQRSHGYDEQRIERIA